MPVVVRPLRLTEAPTFFQIHHRSVRGLAAAHYPPRVIEAWTGPLNEERFIANPDKEIRLIADLDGEPVGYGALVLAPAELRACYVVPEAARSGVGTALVREIERIALQNGVERLDLLSSVNAEPFYTALGYASTEATNHVLGSGQVMAAVKMSKTLRRGRPANG